MNYQEYAINGRFQVQSFLIGYDADGKPYTLSFVKEGKEHEEKLALASNEELVREWISCLRKKRVKSSDVKHVVAAAKRAFATSDPIASATKHRKPKIDLTDVVRLNELCQRLFKAPPTWEFEVVDPNPQKSWSTSKVTLPDDLGAFAGGGTSKEEAKVPAAKAALNYLLRNNKFLVTLKK